MLTVPQAAKRTGRNPETIRRWIREGRLRATKAGTQHLIEEQDLDDVVAPEEMLTSRHTATTLTGEAMPNFVAALRRSRSR